MAFVAGSSRVAVAVGGIDAAMTAATSGTILVLAPGTHTLTIDLKTWVTVRAQWGQRDNTTLHTATGIVMQPWSTVRDLTLTTDTDGVFYGDGDAGSRWIENCVTAYSMVFEGASMERWIIRRCRFTALQPIVLNSGSSAEMAACLFGDPGAGNGISNIGFSIVDDATNGTLRIYNNTFEGTAIGSQVAMSDNASTDTSVYNNLFNQPGGGSSLDLSTTGIDLVYGNIALDSTADAAAMLSLSYGTTVGAHYLYDNSAPRNESPCRVGGGLSESGDIPIDLVGLPYTRPGSSRGAIQWQPSASALYRPWFLDPLSGFSLTYDGVTLNITSGFTSMASHLDVADLVRTYVYDLMHPSRGVFYTTYDGHYRLIAHTGTFDLTITGHAAKIFGAQSLTGISDTGG